MKKYKICIGNPSESDSPCDLCERDLCIGVEECENYYGPDSYFKKDDVQSDNNTEQRPASYPERG